MKSPITKLREHVSSFLAKRYNERWLKAYFKDEIKEGSIVIEKDEKGYPHAYTRGLGLEVTPGD